MWDVEVNCSTTDRGWFEFKVFLTNSAINGGWESDINQSTCSGTAGGNRPASSNANHFARCGYLNVFKHNENSCIIDSLQ